MPITSYSTDQWAAEVYQGLHKLDVSEILAWIEGDNHSFLDYVGFSPEGGDKSEDSEIRWVNDELNPITFTAAHTYSDDAGDNLVVSAPSDFNDLKKIVRSGSIIKPVGADLASDYRYQVDDQTISSTTITITAYGNKGKGSSVNSQVWQVVGNPYTEAQGTSSDDISRDRSLEKNYPFLYERAVDITSIGKVVKQYGLPSVLKHQITNRTKEIKREMNTSALESVAFWDGAKNVGHRDRPSFKGIRVFIEDYGDSNTYKDAGAVDVSESLINGLIKSMYDLDGLGDGEHFILVGPTQQQKLSNMSEDFIRMERTDKGRGIYAAFFMSNLTGKEYPIILDKWMANDSLGFFDRKTIAMKHLVDNHLRMMELTGSRTLFGSKWQIGGIYTLEVRNAGQKHGWMYNLKTT
jgi:hypothetical protein